MKGFPHVPPQEHAELQLRPYLLHPQEIQGFFFPRPFLQEQLISPSFDWSVEGVGIDTGLDGSALV